ncbi:hypothetical protein CEY11_09075 [Candidimonas nitroreducens]|uniref:Uncharacterized protein n=1 Tax=Candidimonas nitroreducens TaxID=683354 RepID=A0A225MTH7_9BURK|nr:hypothetical protein CEY11_09075 [Candidimonas nitroreducens]
MLQDGAHPAGTAREHQGKLIQLCKRHLVVAYRFASALGRQPRRALEQFLFAVSLPLAVAMQQCDVHCAGDNPFVDLCAKAFQNLQLDLRKAEPAGSENIVHKQVADRGGHGHSHLPGRDAPDRLDLMLELLGLAGKGKHTRKDLFSERRQGQTAPRPAEQARAARAFQGADLRA